MNTTLQGNETRAYFTHFFEQIIQAAREQRKPRNEDMTSRTTKASLGVTKYSQEQTSGHANSSSPKFVVESQLTYLQNHQGETCMQKDGGNPHASMSILPIIMATIRVMEEVREVTHDNLNTFRIQKIRMKQGQKLYPMTVILS
ncbi:unnamed protein product [Prunus armeniaca]|uniref:Uncharacterized protein n=1 Tax=Prunus armeniaca TaxID=36596 RepID=A0A6J5VDM0_PRUAR|nr:unnamed protein product [Prunus armeniaca]